MIQIDAMFPVMATSKLDSVKQFYEAIFGFNAVFFDPDFYLHLVLPSGVQLGFLVPNHESQPAFLQPQMVTDGYVISFEVKDAHSAYAQAKEQNLAIVLSLKEEVWGQLHFILEDPAGFKVDVVQHLEVAQND